MERKKLQSVSIAALIVSILPLAALAPSFLHLSAAGGSCPVVPAPFAVGQSPNRLGRSQYRFCPAEPDPFGGMCAEQGKPQRYQYRIHGNQRVLGVTDGGNCCACRVPYFRSVRKLLCGKSLDVA